MTHFKRYLPILIVVGVLFVAGSAYAWYFSDRIAPRTLVGTVAVGGLTRDEAAERIQEALDIMDTNGVSLNIEGANEVIQPAAVGFDIDLSGAVERAFSRGHTGSVFAQLWGRIGAWAFPNRIEAPVVFNDPALRSQVADIADTIDVGRKDVRLQIKSMKVSLLTDTAPGRVLDQDVAIAKVRDALRTLSTAPVILQLRDDMPRANAATANKAVTDAKAMLARPIVLQYEDAQFVITGSRIGSWIVSRYDGDQLKADLHRESISTYVTTIAKSLNIDPQPARITTEGGRVVGFTPPKVGRAVQEDALVQLISDAIMGRLGVTAVPDTIVVPMQSSKMSIKGLDDASGITELVGKATTPFTGSPKNRISNIKNGVKFLTGTIVMPGEEFSTLKTLGVIDNTTGYLPELVIKGDRTQPEFGGGLCQVSTTLFRAVLNTGLPVTARRNHSYRVSYYEKDGDGKVIGPGLDATIYDPDVDFRFVNDMKTPVLIIGYVIGDKITFELYGTKDGRTSQIIGPKLLSETPSGEPIYIETTDLAAGIIKQVETPHPGGSATATYVVTYADGTKKTTEFKSWYRRWPAQYLKGVVALSAPTPTPAR